MMGLIDRPPIVGQGNRRERTTRPPIEMPVRGTTSTEADMPKDDLDSQRRILPDRDITVEAHHDSTRRRRAKLRLRPEAPGYEQNADWTCIETALLKVRQDAQRAPDRLVETGDAPRRQGAAMAWIGDPVARAAEQLASQLVPPTAEDAMTSAMIALKPHLREMVATEDRNRSSGRRTPSPATLEWYFDVFTQLLQRYCHEKRVSCDLDDVYLPDFGEWLLSLRSELKRSSWRSYRTAVLTILERHPSDDSDYVASLLLAEDDPSGNTDGCGASGRARYFDPIDFDRTLYVAGGRARSARAAWLVDYLEANIRLGLRPCEFLTSELRLIPDRSAPYDRQAWLFICNAKFGSGYANGPIRCLDLSLLENGVIATIWRVMQNARLQEQIIGYDRWLNALNMALRSIHKGLCDRRGRPIKYTAYSLRHQAIGNWRSIHDPVTVAALAGHAVPGTAMRHYGDRKHVWPAERLQHNMAVRPCDADIERINNRLAWYAERRAMQQGRREQG